MSTDAIRRRVHRAFFPSLDVRVDGRSALSPRPLDAGFSVVAHPLAGSVELHRGGTRVRCLASPSHALCAGSSSKEDNQTTVLEVAVCQANARGKAVTSLPMAAQAVKDVLQGMLLPSWQSGLRKLRLDITVLAKDGSEEAAIINCAFLSCIHAGVPCCGFPIAFTVGVCRVEQEDGSTGQVRTISVPLVDISRSDRSACDASMMVVVDMKGYETEAIEESGETAMLEDDDAEEENLPAHSASANEELARSPVERELLFIRSYAPVDMEQMKVLLDFINDVAPVVLKDIVRCVEQCARLQDHMRTWKALDQRNHPLK